ncbi:MAG: alpha/beta hydrolase [Gallicola sp.]|nr:alpha/beta hydrolase [Gallicola sp.]
MIIGDHDVVDLEHRREIKENLPNSTWKIIEDSSHNLLKDHPEKLYNLIKDYLDSFME